MSSTYAFIPSAAKDFANRSLMYALECNPPSCENNVGDGITESIGASYGNELPDKPELPEIPDIALHRVDSKTSGVPVEGRT